MERIEGNLEYFALFPTVNGDLQMGSSLKQCYLPGTIFVTWTKIPVFARKAFLGGETGKQLVDYYLLKKAEILSCMGTNKLI